MKTCPFGAWPSPITAEAISAGSLRLSSPAIEGGRIVWLEIRPEEGGRSVFMRCDEDGGVEEMTPAPFSVRSRVHEYGGGAYAFRGDRLWFSNEADGRIMVREKPSLAPRPLTAAPDASTPCEHRFGDLTLDRANARLLAVRERHSGPNAQPINDLVAISLESGAVRSIASGHDFYASPAPSPDGRRLAWLAWDQPDMPWDAAILYLADIDDQGLPTHTPRRLMGGPMDDTPGTGVAAFQPAWAADGSLWFVADPDGWWNLFRWRDGDIRCMHRAEHEFGKPLWQLGTTTFGFDGHGDVICSRRDPAGWRLGRLRESGIETFDLPWTNIDGLRVEGDTAVFIGGAPDRCTAVVSVDLATGRSRIVRESSPSDIDEGYLSRPVAVSFPTLGEDEHAHAFAYAPHNTGYRAPEGERPPLLVILHGGPTSASSDAFNPMIQFWTSRGFAVLDVDYRGSTGYGRAYRERLYGQWGVADVEDCVAGAMHLVARGQADRRALAIRGGSAGGYTALAALAFHDVFRAGASYYGICDLEVLAQDTHKFEARYLDRLIGDWPAARDLYRARSPLHHVSQVDCPTIFFQGLDDRVVPPNQSELMVKALDRQGLPVAALTFEGEGHGFRQAPTLRRCLEAELLFYGRVFGFEPADPIEPLEIRNLPTNP